MLAKTHGQPASPTRLGKEFHVFVERLEYQFVLILITFHIQPNLVVLQEILMLIMLLIQQLNWKFAIIL
jgi:hypothetical protein